MKLYELAKLVRAKNAGPFVLTIDILFENDENYERVKSSKVLTPALISKLYGVQESLVEYYESPKARALKISFPRLHAVGDPEDTDIFGGQFHSPLVDIEIG